MGPAGRGAGGQGRKAEGPKVGSDQPSRASTCVGGGGERRRGVKMIRAGLRWAVLCLATGCAGSLRLCGWRDCAKGLALSLPLVGLHMDAAAAVEAIRDDGEERVRLESARQQMDKGLWTEAVESLGSLVAYDEENPIFWRMRGEAELASGRLSDAERDLDVASARYTGIGDKIAAAESLGLRGLAQLGLGRVQDATATLGTFSKTAKLVASNNPADLPLLQDLARQEAESHLALAGTFWKEGRSKAATEEWIRGCVRLEGCEVDAAQRRAERDSRLAEEKRRMSSKARDLGDVGDIALARITGMDPNSAYITRRESDTRLWGQFVPGKAKDFDPNAALPARLDDFQGCRRFKDAAWVRENRRLTWAPVLMDDLGTFVAEYDFDSIQRVKDSAQVKVAWDELAQ